MSLVQVWSCLPGSGQFSDVSQDWEGKTVNEIAEALPVGVYTTLRTYRGNKCFYLEHHFSRLVESAQLLGVSLSLETFNFREKLRIAINTSHYAEKRIRIHIPLNQPQSSAYLMVEELEIPSAQEYRNGVATTTSVMHRDQARAKSTSFISSAEHIRKLQPAGINEVLMINTNDNYLEGLSSNFFGVSQGVVWTAEQGVLAGITRDITLKAIRTLEIPVRFEGFPAHGILELEEAFITSTSRGILPVSEIDRRKIGNGRPGPLTLAIQTRFEEIIASLLETV